MKLSLARELAVTEATKCLTWSSTSQFGSPTYKDMGRPT